MMTKHGFLLLWCVYHLFAVSLAESFWSSGKECEVSDWAAWGDCSPLRDCGRVRLRKPVKTVAMGAAVMDVGRVRMAETMAEKDANWVEAQQCHSNGTCPQDNLRPSSGPHACENGSAGDLPCWNVDLKSFLNIYDLGYVKSAPNEKKMRGNDCWGWTDPQSGDEYAIIGLTGGTSFVRITNPEKPVPVGFIYTQTYASTWRDIKVVNDHAFIVSEAGDHGMQVFDLTKLRGVMGLTYFKPTNHYAEFGSAHNIVESVEAQYVYAVGAANWQNHYPENYTHNCNGGLHAVNVSDPSQPQFAGCYDQDGYTHDAQCVQYTGPDRYYKNKEICFCYNEDSLTIVDVSDKSNMRLISKRGYTSSQYTHQGWLTEDQSTIVMDDELDERRYDPNTKTLVWDVKRLDSPKLVATYRHGLTVIDHNQYVKGSFTYQANYQGGLRILHINQEHHDLHEVGYLDVYPAEDSAQFKGAWSVYPYFTSGNVLISSIDFGLFVVRPDYDALREESVQQYVHAERSRTRGVTNSTDGATCPPLRETQMCASVRCGTW